VVVFLRAGTIAIPPPREEGIFYPFSRIRSATSSHKEGAPTLEKSEEWGSLLVVATCGN